MTAHRYTEDEISATLTRHHALFTLLPEPHRHQLLDFVYHFLRQRDIHISGEQPIDLLVACNAALVGMHQPVDYFSSINWIYIGNGSGEHDGEAWGSNKLLLESSAVVEESAHIIPGANVVIHEFAHVMDQLLGISGRTPALREALEAHLEALNAGRASCIADWRDSISIDSVMDSDFHYLEQVEFFAYASEAFFTAAPQLREEIPGLYDELLKTYKIDMAKVLE